MSKEIGEIDWNAADMPTSKGKNQFMKLVQGNSVVRIMTNPYQYYCTWLVLPDGSKRKINSPNNDPALLQRLEAGGFPRKPSWFLKVLDRTDADESKHEFKILEIGKQIYDGVLACVSNKRYGKVTGYDIEITRGAPGQMPLYKVMPLPPEALDSNLKAKFAAFNESVNLEKLASPMPSAEIEKLLGWSPTQSDDGHSKSAGEKGGKAKTMEYDFE